MPLCSHPNAFQRERSVPLDRADGRRATGSSAAGRSTEKAERGVLPARVRRTRMRYFFSGLTSPATDLITSSLPPWP